MTVPELTLEKVKKTEKVRNFRASDFLTDEEVEEVQQSNARGRRTTSFDAVDAYIAEMIARFGYDTYKAWLNGEIDEAKMARYIEAERVREVKSRLRLETIIVSAVSGANNPTKGGHVPKGLKVAMKMLKNEEKIAKGGK